MNFDRRPPSASLASPSPIARPASILSARLNGTPWTVTISQNDTGATILAIPEPATLTLLALGGLAVIRCRRK